MNKKHLLFIALPLLAVTAFAGAVYADSQPVYDIASAIAQKFNLNASDVQQVMDEHRDQMQAQRQERMQQNFTEKLSQAVADGKLTQAQADLITAKRSEMEALRQEFKPGLENRDEMMAKMDELKQWAEDNNIPVQYFAPMGKGFGAGRGHGMGAGGDCPLSADNTTSQN